MFCLALGQLIGDSDFYSSGESKEKGGNEWEIKDKENLFILLLLLRVVKVMLLIEKRHD